MKIVIAGAGVGGLAAALALARLGHAIDVIEQAPELADVGAGLQLSPNAVKALDALDLRDAVQAVSQAPEALEMRDGQTGAPIFQVALDENALAHYGAPYWHIHRADLLACLEHAARGTRTIRLRLGVRVSSLSQVEDVVRIGLDTGEILHADVLIGADGLQSTVRRSLLGIGAPRLTGCVAWRLTVPFAGLEDHFPRRAATVWAGDDKHVVTYRLRQDAVMNFVGVAEHGSFEGESWTEPGDVEQVRAAFAGWAAPINALLDRADTCWRWALYDRNRMPVWSLGRVTLLGDACHPMLPFQAQGAAMALEDAVVLARCLAATDDPAAALRQYQAARMHRTAEVVQSARANRRLFHRRHGFLRAATLTSLRLANRVAPAFLRSRLDGIYRYDPQTAPI
jgi:salicylate hydroxylase